MPDFFLDVNRTAPGIDAAEVTTADGADLPTVPTRGLYIGTSGDLKVAMASGAVVTFVAVPVGVHPFQVKRVYQTGTSADDIVALY